jgi:hypothetical protein
MKRLVPAFAVVASLLLAPAARSQTAPVGFTFTAVDAVTVDHTDLEITGILEGESAPVTRTVYFGGFGMQYSGTSIVPYEQRQACERLAVAAMARPGFYVLVITLGQMSGYPSCTLRRASP